MSRKELVAECRARGIAAHYNPVDGLWISAGLYWGPHDDDPHICLNEIRPTVRGTASWWHPLPARDALAWVIGQEILSRGEVPR